MHFACAASKLKSETTYVCRIVPFFLDRPILDEIHLCLAALPIYVFSLEMLFLKAPITFNDPHDTHVVFALCPNLAFFFYVASAIRDRPALKLRNGNVQLEAKKKKASPTMANGQELIYGFKDCYK